MLRTKITPLLKVNIYKKALIDTIQNTPIEWKQSNWWKANYNVEHWNESQREKLHSKTFNLKTKITRHSRTPINPCRYFTLHF